MIFPKQAVLDNSIDVSGKRIIVRVDFNVPAEDGIITDDYRILRTRPLLQQLQDAGARMVLIGHLTEKKTHRSFQPLLPALQRSTGLAIEFAPSVAHARKSEAPVVLLENLRVFRGEEAADDSFAEELSTLGDIYVNEAFSQSHRPYASIVGLPKFLPSYFGPLFYRELEKLSEVSSPDHPFVFILGGMKFETKIGVLRHFLGLADTIFIGGALGNTFLAARGFPVGESVIERTAVPRVQADFLESSTIMLPADVRVAGNEVRSVGDVQADDVIYDIGPQSTVELSRIIGAAHMVLWNGPLGFTERGYRQATVDLVDTLASAAAHTRIVIGGGDTLSVIRERKLENAFYHVSTGGGAMLEFLAKGTLPGVDAIRARFFM